MSLINDVLRDLDRRRNSPRGHVPPGVRPAPGTGASGPYIRRVLLWSTVAALFGAAVYLTHVLLPRTPPEIAEPQTPPAMPAAEEDVPAQDMDRGVPGLQQITVHDAPRGVELRFLADGPVVHVLQSNDDGGGITLRLPVAGAGTDLPELLGRMPALRAVDWRVHDEHLTLDLRFHTAPRLQARRLAAGVALELEFPDGDDPEAEQAPAEASPEDGGAVTADAPEPAETEGTEIADAAEVDEADTGGLVEDPLGIPVADGDAADARGLVKSPANSLDAAGALRRGRDAEEAGETSRAMAIYREALGDMPDAWRVRRALAAIHQGRGERAVALEILAQGLEHEAGAAELARLKARLLREQDPEAAIRVLEKHPAPVFGEGRWHALLAALYRQSGRAEDAVPLYRELAREQSSEGRWWLGLGVSLEESGEPARARAAYQRALAVGGLNSELTAFLRQRIESLE